MDESLKKAIEAAKELVKQLQDPAKRTELEKALNGENTLQKAVASDKKHPESKSGLPKAEDVAHVADAQDAYIGKYGMEKKQEDHKSETSKPSESAGKSKTPEHQPHPGPSVPSWWKPIKKDELRACMKRDAEMHSRWKAKMAKDDKPHAKDSPEDKAHDVVEESQSISEAAKQVKGDPKKMFEHLRSYGEMKESGKEQEWKRSAHNAELGKADVPSHYQKWHDQIESSLHSILSEANIKGTTKKYKKPNIAPVVNFEHGGQSWELHHHSSPERADKVAKLYRLDSNKRPDINSRKFISSSKELADYLHSQKMGKSADSEEKKMDKRCWEGYEPTPGKKPYSKGSCRPVKKAEGETAQTEQESLEKFNLKSKHKSKKGGLTEAGRKAYNRATGSNLKRPQPEGGSRKKSYCARSAGQMKMHGVSCSKTPDKRICLARRRWKC